MIESLLNVKLFITCICVFLIFRILQSIFNVKQAKINGLWFTFYFTFFRIKKDF